MRKDTTHDADRSVGDSTGETEDHSSDWMDGYPSETIEEAVPIDGVTAGVDVTRYDLDETNAPPMFEVKENYPPEDDVAEESAVYFHGEYAAAQVAAAIAQLLSGRFDADPWDDVGGGER